ncbi:MAG: lysophospholipid acyltransferase family protein [Deltaproteobacteria bacterium]|nr:lysophospholipid acyltransferase family protein [Deltaproteobacteria bacterium]
MAPSFRHRLEYAGFLLVYATLAALPLEVAMRLAAAVAVLAIRLDRRHRRIGLVNLAIAFPEKSPGERLRILVASHRNLGRMIAECAHIRRLTRDNVRARIGFADESLWRQIPDALGRTGILVLTGHFGNWELFAHVHGLLGHPVHLVRQTIKNPFIDAFVDRMRRRAGTRTLRKHAAARGVLRALGDHQLMVLPLDQNASRRTGVFVEFFGKLASTNSGFGRIAARTGVPVYPAFLVREGTSARHRIVILPRVPFASMADRDQAAREFTQLCTVVLEAMIREHPDHWLWTHKRWRTRPVGEPDVYER